MEKQNENAVPFCENCPTSDNEFGREYCAPCATKQIDKLDGFLRETPRRFELAPGLWQKKTKARATARRNKEIRARNKQIAMEMEVEE